MIAWANLTTVGVMPAAKYDWFLTSLTNILSCYKRNGLGVIVHCNRASDNGRTSLWGCINISLFHVFVVFCGDKKFPVIHNF